MKTPNLSAFFKNAGRWAKEKSPQILVAVGIIGMAGTVVATVKATTTAKELIDAAEEEKEEPLTPAETVKTVWKCYAIPFVAFLISAGCIIGANAQNTKRNAALMTACSLSQTALKTYQEKVVETIGEEEEKKIRKKTREEIETKTPDQAGAVYILGGEKVECMDSLGNRFRADPIDIQKAVNEVNKIMVDAVNPCACVGDFYEAVGADHTPIDTELGWNRNRDGNLDVRFTSIVDKYNRPLLVVCYSKAPYRDYDC